MRLFCVLLASAFAFAGMTLAGCDRPATVLTDTEQPRGNALSMKIDRPKSFTASVDGWVLRLEAVTFRGSQHTGLRIFVNHPVATADTPTSDRAYLGSISPGHYDTNFVSTGDFVIDLGAIREPTKKLLLELPAIEITCVPLVRDRNSEAAVTVGKIRLERLHSSR
jgi:hypothetical protein